MTFEEAEIEARKISIVVLDTTVEVFKREDELIVPTFYIVVGKPLVKSYGFRNGREYYGQNDWTAEDAIRKAA